jgi:hypothetical protein
MAEIQLTLKKLPLEIVFWYVAPRTLLWSLPVGLAALGPSLQCHV